METEQQQQQHSAEWPYVAMLSCVFILSITLPLAWHREQRHADIPQAAPTAKPAPAAQHEAVSITSRTPRRDSTTSAPAPKTTKPEASTTFAPTTSAAVELNSQIQPEQSASAPAPSQPAVDVPTDAADALTSVEKVVAQPAAGMFADLIELDPAAGPKIPILASRSKPGYANYGIPRSHLRYEWNDVEPAPLPPQTGAWPVAAMLQARLDDLTSDVLTQAWADSTREQLLRLRAAESLRAEDVPGTLNALRQAADAGERLAANLDREQASSMLRAAVYDLRRRNSVWQAAYQLARNDHHARAACVIPLVQVASASALPEHPPGKIDIATLLAQIEEYEELRLNRHGHLVANAIGLLRASATKEHRQLGEQLEQHYRNANYRLAVSGELLNRMLPKPETSHRNVNERILGVPVWGKSRTLSQLYLRLIPDPQNIRLGAEAWGKVSAHTTAASGPAQVVNNGRTAFVVQKLFLIDHEGVKTKQTQVQARSVSDLVDLQTDYDGVPLLGGVARNIARREHDERRGAALRETERKVEIEARKRFDAQILPRIQKSIGDFQEQFWDPLEKLGLEPTPVELSTTKRRAISRMRVGHEGQLAAHTARPRAPSNSMASMQIHESLLNNGLNQLRLDGKTYSLHELYKVVARRLDRPVDEVPETMPENVFVSFARHDSLRVRCDDGRVVLTLALAKVERGKSRWTNLTVRASYEPQRDGLNVKLQRQGAIELTGSRLRTRDQVALRGVFSKLLSKSHEWQMLPQKIVSDPRLSGLAVSQAKITDGWIGIAIAPAQQAAARIGRSVSRK